jgi:hypothetical protein
MFRKLISTWLLLVVTAVGTGGTVNLGSAPAVQSVSQAAAPTAQVMSVQQVQSVSAPLSAAQMSADQGEGIWGWIKKMWKKYKKQIIKIIWEVISTIITQELSETTEAAEGVEGTVVENYEGTDETNVVYGSESDYNANNVQSTSYYDGGYAYQSTDYSSGYYSGGGEY